MVRDNLVTKTQGKALKELGFEEITLYYYSAGLRHEVSVPTTDEAIDWLRRKYNIIVYNKVEPFVDPTDDTHKTILFKYGIKLCDTHHLGWNGRTDLGTTRLAKNAYSLKREAIGIALKYIKSQKK